MKFKLYYRPISKLLIVPKTFEPIISRKVTNLLIYSINRTNNSSLKKKNTLFLLINYHIEIV